MRPQWACSFATDQPENQREEDTDKNACIEGKLEGEILALEREVSWKAAEPA